MDKENYKPMNVLINRLRTKVKWDEKEFSNNIVFKLIKKYLIWNKRWVLSVVLRYYPVIQYIKHVSLYEKIKICEVGSGDQGIGYYLKQEVTGVDLNFNKKGLDRYGQFLMPYEGSATKIPFKDKKFDIVISIDMLEHLNNDDKYEAIKELFRISNKYVIIAAPFSGKVEEYEKKLNNIFIKKYGQGNKCLEEHMMNGLPDENKVIENIQSIAGLYNIKINISVKKNVTLPIWYFTQYIETIKLLNIIHRLIFSPLFHLFKFFNYGDCYRKIIFVEKIIS